MAHRIQTVLLDVYGTLLESDDYQSPYSHLFQDLNLSSADIDTTRKLLMTHRLQSMADAARLLERHFACGPATQPAVLSAERELQVHLAGFYVIDHTIETLHQLRNEGFRIALVSNLATPYRQPLIDNRIEPLVDAVAYSYEVGDIKPSPIIFRHALELLNATTDEAVMIGDNEIDDVDGAIASGIASILVQPGEGIRNVPKRISRLQKAP